MPDREKVEFIESYIKIGNGDYQWNDNHGELVRCKDCKHYKDGRCFFTMRRYGLHDDWFCADGERGSDDG